MPSTLITLLLTTLALAGCTRVEATPVQGAPAGESDPKAEAMSPEAEKSAAAPTSESSTAPKVVETPQAVVRIQPPGRVVAVGDLHGDLDNAVATLHLAGVTDAEGRWTGGDTGFVQTGDITDRGPDSGALIELLKRLQAEAPKTGGQVVALLGNHEAMNLTGDWRYVHEGDIAAYGGEAARKQALGPEGEHGQWLRARPAAAIVGDTVFVHGGIRAALATEGLAPINVGVHQSLTGQLQGPAQGIFLGPNGPLWYRGYVNDPEPTACSELSEALGSLGVQRMVVGHTTRRDGHIASRCGGRLQVIDIGIADPYGGHLGAWVQDGGDARAVYPDGPTDLEDPA